MSVEMGYDPFTKKQLDAEYHYDNGQLFMIRSSTGIEILPDELPDKAGRWVLPIKCTGTDDLDLQKILFNVIKTYLLIREVPDDDIDEMIMNSDYSIVVHGSDLNINWNDKNE